MHPRGNRSLLFLISSKGVPKHWTTSVNKGDTEDVYNWAYILRRNWCYQLSFPRVILATIFFNTIFRFTNFLSFVSAAWRSARNSCSQGQWIRNVNSIICLQTSIFPRWKNFASCPDWAIETAFEQVVWVYERHDRIVDERWWSSIVFASVMTKALEAKPWNLSR